jgi:hypothetical protein
MIKKRQTPLELKDNQPRADGGDWTLTVVLERRRAPIGWVARDAAWPLVTRIFGEALDRLPSNARVYLDCQVSDSATFLQKKR